MLRMQAESGLLRCSDVRQLGLHTYAHPDCSTMFAVRRERSCLGEEYGASAADGSWGEVALRHGEDLVSIY